MIILYYTVMYTVVIGIIIIYYIVLYCLIMSIVFLFSSIQNGKTALDRAKEYNKSEVVALLEGQST